MMVIKVTVDADGLVHVPWETSQAKKLVEKLESESEEPRGSVLLIGAEIYCG